MLTFIRRTTPRGARSHRALYRCHCGREVEALIQYVNGGRKRSCGCDSVPHDPRRLFDYAGERLSLTEIVAKSGSKLTHHGVKRRLNYGASLAEALTRPKYSERKRLST